MPGSLQEQPRPFIAPHNSPPLEYLNPSELVEHATLDLRVVSSRPMLDIEIA